MSPDLRKTLLTLAEDAASKACLSQAAYRGAVASGSRAAANRAREMFRQHRDRTAHWLERAGLGAKAEECRRATLHG